MLINLMILIDFDGFNQFHGFDVAEKKILLYNLLCTNQHKKNQKLRNKEKENKKIKMILHTKGFEFYL